MSDETKQHARDCGARIVMDLPREFGVYPQPADVQMLPKQLYAFARTIVEANHG
ncbi:MAG: hypothetical protein KF822_09565 [Steroidobacteraceae bacterium]|nr:hypothetical protein [Steroidobacteraceae bacterium]